jgi:hypothetical protein
VAVTTGRLGCRWRDRLPPERLQLAFRVVVGCAALTMLARLFR